MRLISTAIAVVFMIVTILASTESVSAAAKLKVTAERQTIYVGETVKLKANKKGAAYAAPLSCYVSFYSLFPVYSW